MVYCVRTYTRSMWTHYYTGWKTGLGVKIGDVECCATACADDITINSNNEVEAQTLVNMATDYNSKEQYKIQPEKSVVIDMGITKTKGERSTNLKIHDKELPIVNTTTHWTILLLVYLCATLKFRVWFRS